MSNPEFIKIGGWNRPQESCRFVARFILPKLSQLAQKLTPPRPQWPKMIKSHLKQISSRLQITNEASVIYKKVTSGRFKLLILRLLTFTLSGFEISNNTMLIMLKFYLRIKRKSLIFFFAFLIYLLLLRGCWEAAKILSSGKNLDDNFNMPFLRNEFFNQEIEIRAEDLRLTFVTFRNLLAVKLSIENCSNWHGITCPLRHLGG